MMITLLNSIHMLKAKVKVELKVEFKRQPGITSSHSRKIFQQMKNQEKIL